MWSALPLRHTGNSGTQMPRAISADCSTIVGYGTDPSGFNEGWIAVIPEPATGMLVMAGVLGLAITRRTKACARKTDFASRAPRFARAFRW